jgi:hypothetical protein
MAGEAECLQVAPNKLVFLTEAERPAQCAITLQVRTACARMSCFGRARIAFTSIVR